MPGISAARLFLTHHTFQYSYLCVIALLVYCRQFHRQLSECGRRHRRASFSHREGRGGAARRENRVLPILVGIPVHHPALQQEMKSRRIPPLTALAPGPEGFLVQTAGSGNRARAGHRNR